MSYENLFSNDDDTAPPKEAFESPKKAEEDTLLGSFFQSIYSPSLKKAKSFLKDNDQINQVVNETRP